MALDERRKTLEEEFFRNLDAEQLEQWRNAKLHREKVGALRNASGLSDEPLLNALLEAGITAASLAAISLVPLVEVAWADGVVAQSERDAIVRAAEAKNVAPGTESHILLSAWLDQKPSPALFAAWRSYVTELLEHLTNAQQTVLYHQVIRRAREVAEAAGGFLGLKTISKSESQILDTLNAVFNR